MEASLPRALAHALHETRGIVPCSRVTAAVLEQDSPWWAVALGALPRENIAEQPLDRGTASGILLAFTRIFRRDPAASIALIRTSGEPETDARWAILHEVFGALDPREGRAVVLGARNGPSFAILASSSVLLRLFLHTQPKLLETFLYGLREAALFDPRALDAMYPFLPEVDFERDVLAKGADLVRRATFSLDRPPGRAATAA